MSENGSLQQLTAPPPPPERDKLLRQLGEALKDLLLAFLVILFLVTFLIQPVRVEGTSMQPQLSDQERIFVNKISYRVFNIERGDVVVFVFPGDSSKSFIKRIIGLPGETIRIAEGRVYIDGCLLDEPYIPWKYQERITQPPLLIPAGHYFVMGDHRNVSNDSRHWGCVPRSAIFGKAVLKYWPPDDIGLVR